MKAVNFKEYSLTKIIYFPYSELPMQKHCDVSFSIYSNIVIFSTINKAGGLSLQG